MSTFQAMQHTDISNNETHYASRFLKVRERVMFDPKNAAHREAYAKFEKTGIWPIMFYTEWPAVTVPQTVMRKISEWACQREFRALEEKEAA